jgi:hypothetical protein
MDHDGLAEVSRSLRTLVQSLGDEAVNEFWRRVLGPLRRIAFAFCSTPLPFANLALIARIDWNQMHRLVRQSQQMYPDSHELLNNIVLRLEQLLLETSSPFINSLVSLHQRYGIFSVVLRNTYMNRVVAEFFEGSKIFRNVKVVDKLQLRGSHQCNMLVMIGPCDWFPEYIFSAPRASTIHVLSFRWIRDGWKPGPLFLYSSNAVHDRTSSHYIGSMPRITEETKGYSPALEDILPPELIPQLSIFGLGGSSYGDSNSENADEKVRARLCHLSGGRAVLIAADEGASSLIIDVSEIGRNAVRRVPVNELEHGLYILLRTSGGGDFIAPLADHILGASATKRRSEQTEWKDRLIRRAVEQFGSISRRDLSTLICSELQSQGLSQARPANIYYWMSSKCIRPRNIKDFAVIMKYAGLEERTQYIWSAMGEIDQAHHRAGQLIRRMLLQKIAKSSLESLERDGEMDFELGDQGGGTLSAYQITEVHALEYDVPSDQIGILLDLEA